MKLDQEFGEYFTAVVQVRIFMNLHFVLPHFILVIFHSKNVLMLLIVSLLEVFSLGFSICFNWQ